MKYEICPSDHNTYLYVHVNESVTRDLLKDFIGETAKKAKEAGIYRFLFDLRRAHNRTSLFTHYDLVYNQSKALGFKPDSKHALVVSQMDWNDYSFVETILYNAGYRSKIFTDELPAIEWLEE